MASSGTGTSRLWCPGLDVVQPQSIEQDQRLAETAAADGQIALDAVGRTLTQIERRIEFQQIGEGVGDEMR